MVVNFENCRCETVFIQFTWYNRPQCTTVQCYTLDSDRNNWSLSKHCHLASPLETSVLDYTSKRHGRPHIGGGKWGQLTPPPGKMEEKLKSENMQKKSSFLCICYILRAIRAGRCRERRYADHIFIQIYFRMHHFVVKFSKFLRLRRQGGIDPLTKILRTFMVRGEMMLLTKTA